ncbi:hypothetical protein [Anaerovorax odorimutans]|uniref:hypothetical protein n=1 Tax=Anaerovorax odorimutans TaxID=109327 RepID=UPI00041F4098|nr:hypothetical protein [Anaerovorax odorimutans]
MFSYINKNIKKQLADNDSTQNSPQIILLEEYLNENPKTGYLVFQITEDSPLKGTLPIANARITVTKKLGEDYFFSRMVTTNEDGKTDPIPLPTVDATLSMNPEIIKPYSTYNAKIEAANYNSTNVYDIPIFDNITSIQPINLFPNGNENQTIENDMNI